MSKLTNIEDLLDVSFKDDNKFFEEKSADMKMNVDYSKCKSIQYKFDKNLPKTYKGGLFPFFKKVEGVCKICDYILFAEKGRRVFCILIELKRGNSQSLPQLNAA